MKLKFWGKEKKPSIKNNEVFRIMQRQELIKCPCGHEYTANWTQCEQCGRHTIETLRGQDA